MALPLALAVAGTALQAYGTFAAAKNRAAAMRQQAMLNRRKAQEVLDREEINRELLFKDAARMMGQQSVEFAASGRAQSATTLAMMEETANLAAEQAQRNFRAAKWEAEMIMIGADSMDRAAKDVATAGTISALGQAAYGAGDIWYNMPGQTKTAAASGGSSTPLQDRPSKGPARLSM